MKEVINKYLTIRNRNIIAIVVIILGIGFIVNYSFFEPTYINEYIVTKVYGEPANSYFDDENFYKCVVDAYNTTNKTSLPYTTNLSDEELESITSLSCIYDGVVSTKGLEKIVNLVNLDLSHNNINEINLEKNIYLEKLAVDNNKLSAIDVSNNVELTFLNLNENNIKEIDISNNKKLTTLELRKNQLSNINLINNEELTRLNIGNNSIKNVDISNNTNLIFLNAVSNQIENIDLYNNIKLQTIYLGINNLVSIDLSKNTELIFLDLGWEDDWLAGLYGTGGGGHSWTSGNDLKNINLTNNEKLKYLNVGNNKLTELDLSKNTELETLIIIENFIEFLDLSKNYKVNLDSPNTSFNGLSYNNISHLIISDNENFDINLLNTTTDNNNAIEYIEINDKSIEVDSSLKMYLNNKIVVNSELNSQQLIDKLNLNGLTAQVYDADGEVTENVNEGYILKIYNDNTEIQSLVIKKLINNKFNDSTFYGCVVKAYNRENKTTLTISDELSTEQLENIEWLECTFNDFIDVTGIEYLINLKTLNLQYNTKIFNLNLKNNNFIEELYLASNSIDNLDISNLYNLKTIDLRYNNINEIDISNNNLLESLSLGSNNLKELDVSNCLNLEDLEASSNQITYLDVTNNKLLETLQINSNNLEKLDVSNCLNLDFLSINNNKIKELDVTNNNLLRIFQANNNEIGKLSLLNNNKLNTIRIGNNKLEKLDLSNNITLTDLTISGNPYGENKYVYKNNRVNVGDVVKIPEQLDWDSPTWISGNTDVASVDSEGIVTAINAGNVIIEGEVADKYTIDSTVNVVEITSDEYLIDEENNYIFIGTDNDIETIKNNINVSDENVIIDICLDNYKLYVKYEDEILKEFDIGGFYSNKYNLNNDYIYTDNDVFNIGGIEVINCIKEVEDNKLVIKYNDEILDEYVLVSISSEVYDLSKDYIYTSTNDINLNDINVINGISEEIDNKLIIKYNDIVLDEYLLVSISSEVYDLSKEYIYTSTNDINLNDINVINGTSEEIDNKLVIKYNEEILDEYLLVSISSESYDLSEDYIYTSTNDINLNDINVINGISEEIDNKLVIKYNDEVLDEYVIISISSEVYDLSNDYIYIGTKNINTSNISVINGISEVIDNKLFIKYNDEVIDEYNLLRVKFNNYNTYGNKIVVLDEVAYEDFINDIEVTQGVTYKLYNNEEEVTSGNVLVDYLLKIYYNDIEIDEYIITDKNEYLEFDDSLDIDIDNTIINKIDHGTSIEDVKNKINTSGQVSVLDKNGNVIEDITNKKIGTGYKFNIEMSDTILEYGVSVRGDVTGEGDINVNDVVGVSRHVIKGNYLEGIEYINASDINSDDKVDINDVIRLAKYIINNGEL